MTANAYLQLGFYVVILIALAKPLGAYMARIYEGKPALLNQVGGPVERLLYRVCGVDAEREMRWTEYAVAAHGLQHPRRCWSSTRCSASRIGFRSIRRRSAPCPRTRRSTPP